jgi:hypothetical protein
LRHRRPIYRFSAPVFPSENNHEQSGVIRFRPRGCFHSASTGGGYYPADRKTQACRASTFTKNTVGKMHCPPAKTEVFFWDASCRGFGVRALKSGQRSWIYQYRDEHGGTRRIVLGDLSAVRLDDAHKDARRKAADVAHGANPSAERKAKRNAGTGPTRATSPVRS